MKTFNSITRFLALAVAMFFFASGAWAEHDGDDVVHDETTVDEGTIDEGTVNEADGSGEEAQSGTGGEEIFYMTGGEGGEESVIEYVDAEGNVYNQRGDVGTGEEVSMEILAAQGGMAGGGAVSLSDTAADQAGIDSANDLSLDVVGSNQADFAVPVEVATTASGGSGSTTGAGSTTRISGGHLGSQK